MPITNNRLSDTIDANHLPSDSKVFFLACFSLSIPAWQLSFNLGVYHTVFYEYTHLIAVASLATLLASYCLPKPKRWLGKVEQLLLLVPIFVFVSSFMVHDQPQSNLFQGALWIADVIIIIFCLPYIFYIIACFANPEVIETIRRKQFFKISAVVALISILGFSAGITHPLHMYC